MSETAQAAGWASTVTEAAGEFEGKSHSSVAVRLTHPGGHRMVIVWTDGKLDLTGYLPNGWKWWTVSDVVHGAPCPTCKVAAGSRCVVAKTGRPTNAHIPRAAALLERMVGLL